MIMGLYNTALIRLCCLMPPLRVTIKTEQKRNSFWNVYKLMVGMDIALFPRWKPSYFSQDSGTNTTVPQAERGVGPVGSGEFLVGTILSHCLAQPSHPDFSIACANLGKIKPSSGLITSRTQNIQVCLFQGWQMLFVTFLGSTTPTVSVQKHNIGIKGKYSHAVTNRQQLCWDASSQEPF